MKVKLRIFIFCTQGQGTNGLSEVDLGKDQRWALAVVGAVIGIAVFTALRF